MVFGFGKKKEPELPPIELPPPSPPEPKPSVTESVGMESLKAKIDLLSAHIESLKAQTAAVNERLENLEKMVKEIYTIAKS